MGQGPDADPVQHRSNSDGATQEPAGRQHRKLDGGADGSDRVAARRKPGHQTVPRAGTEAGSYVQARGHTVEHDPENEEGPSQTQCARLREHLQRQSDDRSDDESIAEGAEARALLERDPAEEHEHAGPDDDPAERPATAQRQPLKFSPSGSLISVEAHKDENNDVVVFTVSDKGGGFPVEEAERIFGKSVRLRPGNKGPRRARKPGKRSARPET